MLKCKLIGKFFKHNVIVLIDTRNAIYLKQLNLNFILMYLYNLWQNIMVISVTINTHDILT